MLSVACDKTDTLLDITDVTSSSGVEMMTVPKESAMALKTLLDSDEMMYKFSYLDENKPEIQGVDSSCFIALCNETWDRRPFFTNRKWENVAALGMVIFCRCIR